jgi:hypothetical protein
VEASVQLADEKAVDRERKHRLRLQLAQFHDRPWTKKHERKRLEELYGVLANAFHEAHPDYSLADQFFASEVVLFVLGVVSDEGFLPDVALEDRGPSLDRKDVRVRLFNCTNQILGGAANEQVLKHLWEIAGVWQAKRTAASPGGAQQSFTPDGTPQSGAGAPAHPSTPTAIVDGGGGDLSRPDAALEQPLQPPRPPASVATADRPS